MRAAYDAAARRFTGLLDELCSELPALRQAADPMRCGLQGVVARRMHAAVAPFASEHFITPMAAVAGSVAEEILGAMTGAAQLRSRLCQQWRRHRAASGRRRTIHGWPDGSAGRARPDANDHRRMPTIPTRRLRPAGATAAVFRSALPTPSPCWREPRRRPTPPRPSSPMPLICPDIRPSSVARAHDLQPDSDLGARLVTRGVGELSDSEIAEALDAGAVARADCSPRD